MQLAMPDPRMRPTSHPLLLHLSLLSQSGEKQLWLGVTFPSENSLFLPLGWFSHDNPSTYQSWSSVPPTAF